MPDAIVKGRPVCLSARRNRGDGAELLYHHQLVRLLALCCSRRRRSSELWVLQATPVSLASCSNSSKSKCTPRSWSFSNLNKSPAVMGGRLYCLVERSTFFDAPSSDFRSTPVAKVAEQEDYAAFAPVSRLRAQQGSVEPFIAA